MENNEQKLKQRIAELEAANAQLQETVSLVAGRIALTWTQMVGTVWMHNLRRDVGTIHSYIALLKIQLQADERDTLTILRYLEELGELAKDITYFPITPPLSDTEGIEKIPVNVFISQTVERMKHHRVFSSVQKVLNLGPDDQIIVRASPGWLRVCLDLIMDNALESMSTSNEKTITFRTSIHDNEVVEIAISDTGYGIPEEIRPKLFKEPIDQYKSKKSGMGIGLLMARSIIQTFKGDIQVTQTDSSGTTITIYLPQAK